ncbi:hypothetical protein KAW53_09040 [Candidatus Bathyarchaeota archaeon]|nr:hypothetical protein [Candidatus Bathyarchaeota archaeon]MCK4439115.1 hypothetical protein [Candidatus Bathyarchaeota archaeon]
MSYLFFCNDLTQDECLRKRLFGNSQRHWDQVKKIRAGTPLFLYNLDTGCLLGPFKAASKPRIHLDPYAFIESGRSYPAQVEVTWTRIHSLEKAHRILPFLSNELKCRLTPTETVRVFKALHEEMSRRVASWL